MNGLTEFVVRKGSSPWINGFAAVLSVLAGALASFFTSSIRLSLALPADPNVGNTFSRANWHFTVEAFVFWALVLGAAGLFALTKYSDTKGDNEHRDFLNKKLHGLESMPPDAFLGKLEAEMSACREIVGLATLSDKQGGVVTTKDIDARIRLLLQSFARIASAYDDQVDGNYRAYLMIFTREAPEAKLERAINLPNLNRNAQTGYLEGFRSLCAVLGPEGARGKIFDDNVEFALPLYGLTQDVQDKNLLPGAPKAFRSERVYECPSIRGLVDSLHTVVGDDNQVTALKKFFSAGLGKHVGSFVSLAVPLDKWMPRPIELEGFNICGVVSIEASHENIFKSAEVFFRPVVQPLLHMLSDLVILRFKSRAAEQRSKDQSTT